MRLLGPKISNWLRETWNKVDLLSYIVFILAVVLRLVLCETNFEWARLFFCFSLIVFIIRFSQIFFVVENLGPKIIMIKNMIVDLMFFLVILALMILTFGVVYQSILHPETTLAWGLINSVIYKPYFQMYGELFLEDFGDGYRWVLLGIYMILTNVLLLNLLIAMFSYTFERVQEKSEILWKYNYYGVVYEHFDRPYIPLLGTLFQMLRTFKCFERCGISGEISSNFRRHLNGDLNDKVTDFVRGCMLIYTSHQTRLRQEDITHKVSNTAHRLELVIEQLEDLKEDVNKQPESDSPPTHHTSTGNVSKHVNPLMGLSSVESRLEAKLSALENLKFNLDTKFDAMDGLKSQLNQESRRLDSLETKVETILELLLNKTEK
ncbi:hypothetical protein EB796_012489 [Bugula neritina]|uniref:Ion transport domain-containing protein n=1 Tax=Bugula neritina TaxID=10212 RepID=A0A7J7JS89_BUGNE|nr:hypothetical protein EB796_012489 [Bugula neritina]